jgi:hypothetical protein
MIEQIERKGGEGSDKRTRNEKAEGTGSVPCRPDRNHGKGNV